MLYKIALFLHVTGSLMLCAALTMEWLCVISIKKDGTIERIKESVFSYSKVVKIGDIGVFMILIPGIYMMVTAWGYAGWAILGFIGLILIGIIGGVLTGKKMKKSREIIEKQNNNLQELGILLKNNLLWFSIKIRTSIFLGVIFLMTAKPDLAGSIIAIGISIMLGALPLGMGYFHPVTGIKNAV